MSLTTIICEATVQFCARFLDKRSQLADQMLQAGRTARQNIDEGSRASATSPQTELSLIQLARKSLNELLAGYEEFLRQRKLRQWTESAAEAQAVRSLGMRDQSVPSDYSLWLGSTSPGIVANCLICLIRVANNLLDQQIRSLEQACTGKARHTEPPARPRIFELERHSADSGNRTDLPRRTEPVRSGGIIPGAPSCPKCGKPMALRTAQKTGRRGSQFWGCASYPKCNGTRSIG